MAQQFQQTAIDLDADGDSLIVVTAPAAPTATEITMVAQQTLLPIAMSGLPIAMSGRRRSRSPATQSVTRPPPMTERGRGWIRAPGDPIADAPRDPSAFHARHPSFAISDAAQSLPPATPKSAAAPPRARARNAVTAKDLKDLEVENRFQQIERRAYAAEERLSVMEQRISATSQLTERLDEFAAGVAVHAARLDELTVTHQTAIEALAATLGAKLEIIEAAFKDCHLKIKELQQATYAPRVGCFVSTWNGRSSGPGAVARSTRRPGP